MDIRHRFESEHVLWIECFLDDKVVAYIKFVMYADDNLRSTATSVNITMRGQKIATQMYMYAHELGYKIKPSALQSDHGKLMWKGFKKNNLPFVQLSRWEKFKQYIKC